MSEKISISGIGSISPLGHNPDEIMTGYEASEHCIGLKDFGDEKALCAELSDSGKIEIEKIRKSNIQYKHLDNSVLMAIFASRACLKPNNLTESDSLGINIGSSRGATTLFEKYHADFLDTQKCSSLTSPSTTLGNISTWVAQDLQNDGPVISHSITCSTALHALLNGIAWIKSGMASKFIVGGSEAPLTSFTLSQMQALRIYTSSNDEYPCKSLDLQKTSNTMVLGEGASVACLETGIGENSLAIIEGIGYATEKIQHYVSISTNAICFQKSMKMALKNTRLSEIDVIVTHCPGTIKGDLAEMSAIKSIFKNETPIITSNKWKIGHTFAASGMLSVEMAVLMLKHNKVFDNPFLTKSKKQKKINKILVNAVGFGGNAVSILLGSPDTFS